MADYFHKARDLIEHSKATQCVSCKLVNVC